MGNISYSRTVDLNRFRKVYTEKRTKKSDMLLASSAFVIESGVIEFSNSFSENYFWEGPFTSAPTVIVTPVDSVSNNEANVNVFVSSITTVGMVVESSQTFTGQVNFQIIQVG